MPKIIAMILELAVFVFALWVLFSFSVFLHEAGHALGYMIATGDKHWHIRVGSGKILLNTKKLTVKLLPFDGFFTPLEKNKIDTTSKLITILSGGPVVSLILVVLLVLVKFREISIFSEVFAPSAVESFINSAFYINLFTLILAVIPAHYIHGEMKGSETDGLQIVNAMKNHRSNP